MGARGPVPKRVEQRHGHRSKADNAVSRAPAASVVVPDPVEGWHPLALDWYLSLAKSGQSVFYQASDWHEARVWADLLSRALNQGQRVSSQLIAAWSAGANSLMTTEGARRRLRIELERAADDPDEDAAVTEIDEWRGRLSGSA